MMKTITKKGKSRPYQIDSETQKRIKSFKQLLRDIQKDPETSREYKIGIKEILRLEPYDLNIFIGLYELADGSISELSKILDVPVCLLTQRIKRIKNNIKKKCCI